MIADFLKRKWVLATVLVIGLILTGGIYFFVGRTPVVAPPPPSGLTKEEQDLIDKLTNVLGSESKLTDKEYIDLLSKISPTKDTKPMSEDERNLLVSKINPIKNNKPLSDEELQALFEKISAKK